MGRRGARNVAGRHPAGIPSGLDGRRRVAIENVRPRVDGGRFAAKRVTGDVVEVTADVFADGHDAVAAVARHRHERDRSWREVAMRSLGNDRFQASFPVDRLGRHELAVAGWIDRFATWRHELERRLEAGQDVTAELEVGARLVEEAAATTAAAARRLAAWPGRLRGAPDAAAAAALDPALARLMATHDPRPHAAGSDPLPVWVDPPLGRCSAWYELFPRSLGGDRHGTLADVEGELDRIAGMGFDIVYLPPVHPIGETSRKGRNNTPAAAPGDVGSPWAIGAATGGHTAVHPDLGTVADVERLAAACAERGMALALDLAFQCSPDHPWVHEHPQWFRHRPDGSIRYAENPPKRYQDIYPLDFETDDWQALWRELLAVVWFWVERGVWVFRVDNPHTKPFAFWEWMIGEVKRAHPDVLFLSEAFTRPRVMERLAKLGFSQSYTYFAWRNTRGELEDYLRELTQTGVREYLRPSFWPNTPDILTEAMQSGGRPTFAARLVLAATLSPSYGIYGPAFELVERRGAGAGSEEYLDSEKYQLRRWDLDDPASLAPLVTSVNRARHEHPALQSHEGLRFVEVDNDAVVACVRHTRDLSDVLLVVVSLDPANVRAGWVELPLDVLGIDPAAPYGLEDILDGTTYTWEGSRNYVELDPRRMPAHLLHVTQAPAGPEASR